MKFIFFADLHMGYYAEFDRNGSRLQRCLDAFEQIHNHAEQIGASFIIDAGDMIDKKNLIDFSVYNEIFKTLQAFSDIPIFSLVGNHNISGQSHPYPTNLLPLSEHIGIVDRPMLNMYGDVAIGFIPFCRKAQDWWIHYTSLTEQLNRLKPRTSILVGHQEIRGGVTGTHNHVSTSGLNAAEIKHWEWVVFGHYHRYQMLGDNVFYIGAAIQHNFGEVGNPQHFMVFDSDTNAWEIVPIEAPQFRFASHTSEIPDDTQDFWRLRTNEPVELSEAQTTQVRLEPIVESTPQARVMTPDDDFNSCVAAYVAARIPPEFADDVLGLVRQINDRR